MSVVPRGLQAEADLDAVARRYAVAVTPHLLALTDPGDARDPIARQFLPSVDELVTLPQELRDPIGDAAHSPVPGIVHRHSDRVLFKAVASCPVYCRFCFRREMIGPGKENALSKEDFAAALSYIAAHPEIREVILTGGDPFILSPRRAAEIGQALGAIAHVKLIRWHTRVPVTDPGRVNDDFVAALHVPGVASWVALHANHSREFSPPALRAIARLVDGGIPLVSQSVLLKGVNDSVEALADLMHAFSENRIKPYYLHHPDLAPGTSHFRVGLQEGLALMKALRARLSGLEMPAYMLDIPGGFGKVPLESDHLEKMQEGWRVRDPAGVWHPYQDCLAPGQS
jgi:lysine 2,3-aminomutase